MDDQMQNTYMECYFFLKEQGNKKLGLLTKANRKWRINIRE